MRGAWKTYLVGGTASVLVHALLPDGPARDAVYLLLGLACVAATGLGHRLHGSTDATAWSLMAAGQLLWVGGDTVYVAGGDDAPFPSGADVLYLLAYPLLVSGLVLLVRSRRRGIDLAGLVDSGIVTVSLGLLSWVVVIAPIAAASDVPVLDRVVDAAYPAADVLLLAVLVRLVTVPAARTPAFRMLAAAVGLLLAADSAFAVIAASPGYQGGAVDLLFLASYVLWGASALHPSARELSEPGAEAVVPLTGRRLGALTAAVLLAPVVLVVQLLAGTAPSTWAVAIASVLLFGLVVVRMHAAVRQAARSTAQRESLQDDLAHQAAHDSLTELANRAHALELITAALHRGRRTGGLVGLLFIDLDRFKAVNDTHGHRAGDDVLRETAARLRHLVRVGDTVGRLGGDEFVVLVEPLTAEEDLVDLAGRLVAAIALPVPTAGRAVTVGASIGVAFNRDGGTDATGLLHEADVAAHRAKTAGRGRVEVFDDALRRELDERAELEEAIRHGLVAGEFVLHYQPVVSTARGELTGHEALLRWNRAGRGTVPPDAFIPVAERSTLICDLGRWVLGEATHRFAAWLAARPEEAGARTTVAVNISGRHVASADVVTDVEDALRSSGLAADRLVLEITETVLIDEPSATPNLLALRALGVRISIDDFGTGYTSIGQLKSLHADTLKIDKSLVASDEPGAAELVELVIRAAHAFGLDVVAEGVERPEQLSALRRAGCDDAQGYLIARPQAEMLSSAEVGGDLPGVPAP